MQTMKKAILIGLIASMSYATSLKDVIDNTLQNNQNLKAENYQVKASKSSYESQKNIFHPTLSIGANFLKLDRDLRATQIGKTTTGYAKLGLNLYDGGKSIATKKQKEYEYKSSQQSAIDTQKSTILQVITLYFNTKTILDNINVYQEKAKTLKAEYQRVKDKYDIQMATKDEVLKLQAEYDSNSVIIEELRYQKEELLLNLSLISGIEKDRLLSSFSQDYNLPNITILDYQQSPIEEALKLSIKAQKENTKAISSINKPFLKIEDTLNFYDYDEYNQRLLSDLPDSQNQLMININYNLFDSSSKAKIEASKLAQKSLQEKLNYLKSQQKMKFELTKQKLKTQLLKIEALKSAVQMGESVYEIVSLKYQNGIVDNITYLDALSKKIYNLALYKQALNDYEIAKANYYFSSGVDFEEVLNSWDI
jgi:outer membrane protein TolC